jgi:hypothetical protein
MVKHNISSILIVFMGPFDIFLAHFIVTAPKHGTFGAHEEGGLIGA